MLALVVFLVSPVRSITDSAWVVYTARSLVARGDVNLDEYGAVVSHAHGFQLDEVDGRHYYSVPFATSASAIPAVLVESVIDGASLDEQLRHGDNQPADAVTAALLAALCTLVVYATALRITQRVGIAVAAGAIFAFATQAWSTASRTVWMHTPSMLCLAVALYCATRIHDRGRWATLLGAVLAFAVFVRPTNVVAAICLGSWIWTTGYRAGRRAAVAAIGVTVVMLTVNVSLYGALLQPYFSAHRLALSSTTLEALVGNLVSPSRGLFLYMPITVVCIGGALLKRRLRAFSLLDTAVAATIIGSWLVASCFPHWWGGWSYGPRFLTDITPLLIWFLVPVLVALAPESDMNAATTRRKRCVLIVVGLVVAFGTVVQARGALAPSTVEWNGTPRDIDASPARLWDWSDPQFLR